MRDLLKLTRVVIHNGYLLNPCWFRLFPSSFFIGNFVCKGCCLYTFIIVFFGGNINLQKTRYPCISLTLKLLFHHMKTTKNKKDASNETKPKIDFWTLTVQFLPLIVVLFIFLSKPTIEKLFFIIILLLLYLIIKVEEFTMHQSTSSFIASLTQVDLKDKRFKEMVGEPKKFVEYQTTKQALEFINNRRTRMVGQALGIIIPIIITFLAVIHFVLLMSQ